jgi:hypothetical protein
MNYYQHHIGDFIRDTAHTSQWVTHNPFSPATLPAGAAVYVILIDGVAVYVGQSQRLRTRFYEHKFRYGYARNLITPWGVFDDSKNIIVKCKTSKRIGDWAMWEIRLIHRLKPIFNKTHMKLKQAAK